jgi:DnaJ-class molecular chaperone
MWAARNAKAAVHAAADRTIPVQLVRIGTSDACYQHFSWPDANHKHLPSCGGEGRTISDKCPACAGNGIVRGEEVISINIPAGVAEGMQLSVSGKGNAAARGGVPGDLIVLIEEQKHPHLIRDGNNLLFEHYVSFPEAALGNSLEVPTLEGRARIKIEPGTQSGKVLRLKGKGLPSIDSHMRGDLLVSSMCGPLKTFEGRKGNA